MLLIVCRCYSQVVLSPNQDEIGEGKVDWEKGLPLDMLALVATLGGLHETNAMRGVCKTWQHGFESGVKSIKIKFGAKMLPSGGKAAQRFPALGSFIVEEGDPEEEGSFPGSWAPRVYHDDAFGRSGSLERRLQIEDEPLIDGRGRPFDFQRDFHGFNAREPVQRVAPPSKTQLSCRLLCGLESL